MVSPAPTKPELEFLLVNFTVPAIRVVDDPLEGEHGPPEVSWISVLTFVAAGEALACGFVCDSFGDFGNHNSHSLGTLLDHCL